MPAVSKAGNRVTWNHFSFLDLVRTSGPRFTLAGDPFPAVGINCYFLAYCSDHTRRIVLQSAVGLGATVVRCWAFLDAAIGPAWFQRLENGRLIQNSGPDGLQRLDSLIAAAEEFGLRLILPLVNYWKDFGGIPQYLAWLSIPGGPDRFYVDPRAREAYKAWVEIVLTRRNTRTGRLYAEEPAVMAWELANEPRCEAPGGSHLLLDWIVEMSAFVKSLDPNHLLAVGDEGRLLEILRLPHIDFGTYHWYPEAWAQSPRSTRAWIRSHVQAGFRADKPVLLEEFGLTSERQRCRWYPRWLDWIAGEGGAGALLWMLGSDEPDVAGYRDPFTIVNSPINGRWSEATRAFRVRQSESFSNRSAGS